MIELKQVGNIKVIIDQLKDFYECSIDGVVGLGGMDEIKRIRSGGRIKWVKI